MAEGGRCTLSTTAIRRASAVALSLAQMPLDVIGEPAQTDVSVRAAVYNGKSVEASLGVDRMRVNEKSASVMVSVRCLAILYLLTTVPALRAIWRYLAVASPVPECL